MLSSNNNGQLSSNNSVQNKYNNTKQCTKALSLDKTCIGETKNDIVLVKTRSIKTR